MTDQPKRTRAGAVARATAAELDDLGLDPKTSAAAAAALRLAKVMDCTDDPKELAAAGRELRQTMNTARGLAPPKALGDRVDQLADRRQRRLSAPAGKGTG
ncbi:hypothetical protein AB0I84_05895 [Streptomyces spectabilis]|uniref:hypothetical protein n=1 Tax=Streptomyces spectabilis TaxID=68270 RepID=UPI0033E80DB8